MGCSKHHHKSKKEALNRMLILWLDHFYLTRHFVIETAANHPGANATLQRLLKNQVDLGNNWSDLGYNGDRYTELLTEHIQQAGGIVGAALKGQPITDLKAQWDQNGKDIADFLSCSVKRLDRKHTRWHMQEHLDTTLAEAVSILNKDYAGSVTAGDKAEEVVIHMAESLVKAIKH